MRIGTKKRPFYRVVLIDERAKRNGAYLELLGTYNPITNPHEIKLKQDRIDHWVKMGAQQSDGFLRIIGKAKQRPPRKAKKNKQSANSLPSTAQKTEEAPVETSETVTEAKPTENTNEVVETEKIKEAPVTEEQTAEPDNKEGSEVIETPQNDSLKKEEKK